MNEQEVKYELPPKIDSYLATLSKYYGKEGQKQLQEIIINSKPRVHTGWSYDNWNGGTHGHALYLAIPESIYLNTVNEKSELQSKIQEGLNKIHDIQNEFVDEVFFEMVVPDDYDWRKDSGLLITHNRVIPDPVANRIWDKDCFRVFLSHKTEVKKETSKLKDEMKLYGISCFVAHEDIHPTREWQNEIENALHTMDSFVALLTEKFHDSLWTDQEVGFAFGRGVPIISVKLGKDPYGFIGKFQALSSSWENTSIEIVKIFIKKDPMLNAYIKAIQNCPEYEIANKLSELLPFIDKLTDIQVENLINGFNENSQVSGSYGFNGEKPINYGYGLVYHLSRITNINFKTSSRGKIIRA
ncbi:MAG: toll/interleukin-1 receptor domain-containing protein [Candidatus Paceibacterota bacterium]